MLVLALSFSFFPQVIDVHLTVLLKLHLRYFSHAKNWLRSENTSATLSLNPNELNERSLTTFTLAKADSQDRPTKLPLKF
jgi:hypothetical protein